MRTGSAGIENVPKSEGVAMRKSVITIFLVLRLLCFF